MIITQQHLDLLRFISRFISRNAIATNQDIALSANVVVALLDEILRLQEENEKLEGKYDELVELCQE